MKNKAIFIILLLFLVATFFFWFQVRRVKDLPYKRPTLGGSVKEVEEFRTLVHEVTTIEPLPLPDLTGLPGPFDIKPLIIVKPPDEKKSEFILSSISYSSLHPLVVINGKILAEGDTIPESKFMIENIEFDKVEISDGKDKRTLNIPTSIGRGR